MKNNNNPIRSIILRNEPQARKKKQDDDDVIFTQRVQNETKNFHMGKKSRFYFLDFVVHNCIVYLIFAISETWLNMAKVKHCTCTNT